MGCRQYVAGQACDCRAWDGAIGIPNFCASLASAGCPAGPHVQHATTAMNATSCTAQQHLTIGCQHWTPCEQGHAYLRKGSAGTVASSIASHCLLDRNRGKASSGMSLKLWYFWLLAAMTCACSEGLSTAIWVAAAGHSQCRHVRRCSLHDASHNCKQIA